jgi:hypothetical protein
MASATWKPPCLHVKAAARTSSKVSIWPGVAARAGSICRALSTMMSRSAFTRLPGGM